LFGFLRGSNPLEQLVVLKVDVVELDLLLLNPRQYRRVFLLHLLQLLVTAIGTPFLKKTAVKELLGRQDDYRAGGWFALAFSSVR
jgi:hypothetical protein